MSIYRLILISFLIVSCNHKKENNEPTKPTEKLYPTVSYLDIKLDESGNLPQNPYILAFENGKKKIVFCGVNHLTDDSDITNPMFAKIEKKFFEFAPSISVNEGGDVSDRIYKSKQEALLKDGEIGLLKILSDSLKIKTVDGDMKASLEFKALLKHYSKGEFLAYIVTERFMWALKGERITDPKEIDKRYSQFIQNYIMKSGGITLNANEQTLEFYKSNYEKLLSRKFNLEELEPTNPFDPIGKFQEIGRKSKEIRDQYLLQTIDNLLNTNDKVFIVFGGWHLLTCEPGLKQIINRKRE
jgi:hypothetical protein